MRSFLTRPSRGRTGLCVVVLVGGLFVLNALTQSDVLLIAWGVLMAWNTLLLLDDTNGEVTNNASIMAGRPIALTARGRARISVDQVTPEQRRRKLLGFATVVTLILLVFVVVLVRTIA